VSAAPAALDSSTAVADVREQHGLRARDAERATHRGATGGGDLDGERRLLEVVLGPGQIARGDDDEVDADVAGVYRRGYGLVLRHPRVGPVLGREEGIPGAVGLAVLADPGGLHEQHGQQVGGGQTAVPCFSCGLTGLRVAAEVDDSSPAVTCGNRHCHAGNGNVREVLFPARSGLLRGRTEIGHKLEERVQVAGGHVLHEGVPGHAMDERVVFTVLLGPVGGAARKGDDAVRLDGPGGGHVDSGSLPDGRRLAVLDLGVGHLQTQHVQHHRRHRVAHALDAKLPARGRGERPDVGWGPGGQGLGVDLPEVEFDQLAVVVGDDVGAGDVVDDGATRSRPPQPGIGVPPLVTSRRDDVAHLEAHNFDGEREGARSHPAAVLLGAAGRGLDAPIGERRGGRVVDRRPVDLVVEVGGAAVDPGPTGRERVRGGGVLDRPGSAVAGLLAVLVDVHDHHVGAVVGAAPHRPSQLGDRLRRAGSDAHGQRHRRGVPAVGVEGSPFQAEDTGCVRVPGCDHA
jgi:hypothetical protein